MIPKSIRWRLPLSYAAIALLTTLSLGLVMLLILRGYYLQRELTYLQSNAAAIGTQLANLIEPTVSPVLLESQLYSYSFLSQTQVRFLDAAGAMVADSGNPQERRDLIALSVNMEVQTDNSNRSLSSKIDSEGNAEVHENLILLQNGPQDARLTGGITMTSTRKIALNPPNDAQDNRLGSPGPISLLSAVGTPYGFGLNAEISSDERRSNQVVRYPIRDLNDHLAGYVELSNGPAYGRDILTSVAWGWAVASTVAVALAAGVGWLISQRLSTPLLALTETTARMASGDLSTRTAIRRDDEVGKLARAFNDMAAQVEATVIALRRFVADAAHELNTPLTALRTNLELGATETDPQTQAAFLGQAQTQVARLEGLASDLLALSRLEAEAEPRIHRPLDLTTLVQQTSELYASQAEQSGLAFKLDLAGINITIHGDEAQLRRALSNLLDNALKFTPDSGQITVGLGARDDVARLWVEDTGIGIPTADLPQLFSRFHRGRNTAAYPGSGLGLAIVKAIAERHQGQVRVVSGAGRTRFELILPLS